MKKLQDLIQLTSGSPQFRITESLDKDAPSYCFYGQQELENDLVKEQIIAENAKKITTLDSVNTLNEGDVVFSLISGRTTIVGAEHNGYLFTQNYVKLVPQIDIDKKYLVYLLNESNFIKKQWLRELQGSAVLKHTVKQLRELKLPELHSYKKQTVIGNIYFEQLRLQALKKRVADTEKILALEKIRRLNDYE
ncbi:MAG: hypothetical protein Q4Q18_03325 [Methanobrevibacter sp.]|nr:hypothetical protein [Methanobrevibacter sp.]